MKHPVGRLVNELFRTTRLRTFTPTNYRHALPSRADLLTPDSPRWGDLDASATGQPRPALLLIHGAGRPTHSGFAALQPEEVAALNERYQGRVFAFDHHPTAHTVLDNLHQLRQLMPQAAQPLSLTLDVLAISRGGLLARALAEGLVAELLTPHRVRVRTVIFVATPNRGTLLAERENLTLLVQALRGRSTPRPTQLQPLPLPGLREMDPMSPLFSALNQRRAPCPDSPRYCAVASEFEHSEPAMREALASIFGESHDGVVPTRGVYDPAPGHPLFPIVGRDRLVLGPEEGYWHEDCLQAPRARRAVLGWLGAHAGSTSTL